MAKNDKPNEINKLARSGDPRLKAQVPAKEQAYRNSKRRQELFRRITGLVVVGSLGATLLAGAISNL